MFTAGEAHADPAIPPDSGTTARRTTLWVPNPQRGDPSWLFRPKNCNPSPASWPAATCDTAAESGAKIPLITRPLQALMDTRLTAPRKEKALETTVRKEIEALRHMTVGQLKQRYAEVFGDLHRQTPEGRRRKLRTYANVGLLCIDEVGYLSFDDKAADLLYEVVNRRYERKPVILTTNRPFKEWNEVFPNATCIVTLLDRLLHHAEVTVVEGDSYRVRESEQETAARRRKK
jgi:hypothetical protein